MVEINHVDANEIKRYFLLANASKKLFIPQQEEKFEELYKRVIDEIFGLNEGELDERITDKVRLGRYNALAWHKGQRDLTQVGTWPKMNSLDARLTTGNVLDTAQIIKQIREGEINLQYKDEEEMKRRTEAFKRFLEKSNSIRSHVDFIYDRFPIILFPGGEVREKDYNVWARENNSPIHKIYEHDLDDGNSRAVSYALEGIESAPCFYGVRK